MEIKEVSLDKIIPYINNPRLNDDAVDDVAASLQEFGWQQPIVLDKDGVIVVGHTRYKAAKKLGLETAPCVYATDLTPAQIKAYRIADNKISEKALWDRQLLGVELEALKEEDFDLALTGFSEEELDGLLSELSEDDIDSFFTDGDSDGGGSSSGDDDHEGEVQCPICGEWFKL